MTKLGKKAYFKSCSHDTSSKFRSVVIAIHCSSKFWGKALRELECGMNAGFFGRALCL